MAEQIGSKTTLCIKQLNGDMLELVCSKNETVSSIKQRIHNAISESPPSSCIRLHVVGDTEIQLENNRTIDSYKVDFENCMVMLFVDGAPEWLELNRTSTVRGSTLHRISPLEFTSNEVDTSYRYVVSSAPLPSDKTSHWAVEFEKAGFVCVGLVGDNSEDIGAGYCNDDHPTFSGIGAGVNGESRSYSGGRTTFAKNFDVKDGDCIWFQYQPLPKNSQLVMFHTRTCSPAISTVLTQSSQHFITVNMARPMNRDNTHIRLRLLSEAEELAFDSVLNQ